MAQLVCRSLGGGGGGVRCKRVGFLIYLWAGDDNKRKDTYPLCSHHSSEQGGQMSSREKMTALCVCVWLVGWLVGACVWACARVCLCVQGSDQEARIVMVTWVIVKFISVTPWYKLFFCKTPKKDEFHLVSSDESHVFSSCNTNIHSKRSFISWTSLKNFTEVQDKREREEKHYRNKDKKNWLSSLLTRGVWLKQSGAGFVNASQFSTLQVTEDGWIRG